MRLVGCAYYSKNLSAFPKKNGIRDSPEDLLQREKNNIPNWISIIRKHLEELPIINEEKLIPTSEVLRLHFLRASYVVRMWYSACKPEPNLPQPTNFGWKCDKKTKKLTPITDLDINLQKVQDFSHVISCTCGKGKGPVVCRNRNCRCVKVGSVCNSSCGCFKNGKGCSNKPEKVEELLDEDLSDAETVTEDSDME